MRSLTLSVSLLCVGVLLATLCGLTITVASKCVEDPTNPLVGIADR